MTWTLPPARQAGAAATTVRARPAAHPARETNRPTPAAIGDSSVVRALVFVLLISLASANAQERVALVVGNSAYINQTPLLNPSRDAAAVANLLRKFGFEVQEVHNASRTRLGDAIVEHAKRLRQPTTVASVFFYAGHGMQVREHNYLIPIDAEIRDEEAVQFHAVDVKSLLDAIPKQRNRVNVMILDACRDNPFERRVRGSSRGLAPIDAATGTLIAYATQPGAVAADGDGVNSPYTEALLRVLPEPCLKIEEIFKKVRAYVLERTSERQEPWESSSLVGDLIINPCQRIDPVLPSVPLPAPELPSPPRGFPQGRGPPP
jgi:uncharacterized caspase-like protein